MNRRQYLTVVSTAGTAALAGCGEQDSESGSTPSGDISTPSIPADQLNGWRETTRDVITFDRRIVTGAGELVQYRNQDLQSEISKKTLGEFDQQVMVFFASKIDLEGLLTDAATGKLIADSAEPKLKSRVKKLGLENIQKREQTQEPQPGVGGVFREIDAEYPVDPIAVPVQIPGQEDRTFRFEAGSFPVRIIYSAWKSDGFAYVAGGAYPSENFADKTPTSVTSELGDGVDAIIAVNLNLEPEKYRSEIIRLIESVE